jgi:hypothetical protein
MVRQTSLLQQPSQQEAQPSQQYQRFLEAAERLGPHLESLFRKGFVQIVSPSRDKRAEVGVRREPAVDPRGALVRPEHATPSNWQDPLSRAPSQTPESEAVDVSIIVRLHFVEAMMVLLFNASDENQQSAIEQGGDRLSSKLGNLEILGVQPGALGAYRDALSAVQKMLASVAPPRRRWPWQV